MKSIAYKDIAGGKIMTYIAQSQTKLERIVNGLEELRKVGDIAVYLVSNRKSRLLFVRRK